MLNKPLNALIPESKVKDLALKSLGFVNRFGYGVQRAQALLAENDNPPAEFEFDEHSVLVKIYKRP
jgi:ATP-dependent DNA helicase RecG